VYDLCILFPHRNPRLRTIAICLSTTYFVFLTTSIERYVFLAELLIDSIVFLLYLFGLLSIHHEEVVLDNRFLRLRDLGECFSGQLPTDLFWGLRMTNRERLLRRLDRLYSRCFGSNARLFDYLFFFTLLLALVGQHC
jgi:hypothetical protein